MSTILSFVISAVCTLLQVVATLDVSAASMFWVYQPKAPKSLIK